MSSLKNVIKKNVKSKPVNKPSKFYKPPAEQATPDVVLPDDIKIELSQDFEAHRERGNASERINDFERMLPSRKFPKELRTFCDCLWLPLFGWIEAPIRIAWHLVLAILFTLLSIITICKVWSLRRMAWNNIRQIRWYLGGLLCCYLPIPCCEADGWPWHYWEYYFASGCFAACCWSDSLIRSWELCFPVPHTEIDYPSECETCTSCFASLCKCCSFCCKCFKKIIPK